MRILNDIFLPSSLSGETSPIVVASTRFSEVIDTKHVCFLSVQVDATAAVVSATWQLEGSLDGRTFAAMGSPGAVTASGTTAADFPDFFRTYARVKVTINSGQFEDLRVRVAGKDAE